MTVQHIYTPTYKLLTALYADTSVPMPIEVGGAIIPFTNPSEVPEQAGLKACPLTDGGVAFLFEVSEGKKEYPIQPTAALKNTADTYIYFFVFETLANPDIVRSLAQTLGMQSLEECVPLPSSGGWELVFADADFFTTPDEMHQHFEVKMYGDAIVMSPYIEADHAQPITITVGSNAEAKNWKPITMPRGQFIARLCKHVEGPKNGPAFVGADMVEGQRLKTAVKAQTVVGLDIDNGTSPDKIDAALLELRCLAVRYTTHSSNKTATEIKKDRIVKYINDKGPGRTLEDDETIRWFLLNAEQWDPAIAATAEYTGTEHTNRGIVVCIKHAPMPKNRVIIPFANPFDMNTVAPLQKDAMEMWKQVPLKLAERLDIPLDTSGTDPSRLFYFPRHPKGKKGDIRLFGGPLLQWESLGVNDPLDKLAADLGKGKGGKSKTDEGRALGRWSIKRSHGFQIVDVIEQYASDRIRSRSGDKVEIECPFDDEHSDAGNPDDRACFAVNAGCGQSEIFTVSCRHDSCNSKTNLDMLGRMIKDNWFDKDVLEDERFNAILDEDIPPPKEGGIYEDGEALVADLAKFISVLVSGNQSRILIERGDDFKLLSRSDAATWLEKYQYLSPKKKLTNGLTMFLRSPERVEYWGITNMPNAASIRGGEYATWRGFATQPKAGDWNLLREHIFKVICGGSHEVFVWLMCWMAQMLQDPANRPGTAVVLRGPKGCGKTTLGYFLRKIIGRKHSLKVSQQRHVTGNFNSHIRDTIFMLVEEGVWGGNKAAEGVLKDLITGDTTMIEEKFVAAVEFPVYTRIMITSNEKWVVPVGELERRYLVSDVKDPFPGLPEKDPKRRAYFDAIYQQMRNGGTEAMMAELMVYDYAGADLRQPPVTDGLARQILASFTPEQYWFLEVLLRGQFTDGDGNNLTPFKDWPMDETYDIENEHVLKSYRDHFKTYSGAPASLQQVQSFLNQHCQFQRKRLTKGGERPYGFTLPPLRKCREEFSRMYKYEFPTAKEPAVVDLADHRKRKA